MAEIPHVVFKCWVIQNLGNNGEESSKIVVNLNILLTRSCFMGAKIQLNSASKNLCFCLVMINKNADSQHKRALESSKLGKKLK